MNESMNDMNDDDQSNRDNDDPDAAAVTQAEPETPQPETPQPETPQPEPVVEAEVEVEIEEDETSGFAELGLRPELLKTLASMGYEEPTPIQRETIPYLLSGKDLVGQAATGTGKTAAFALPILDRIQPGNPAGPFALILVPTRELAMQVSEAIYKYGHDLGARTVPIYGGQHIGRQLDALRRGVHVVVATPGRALDHIRRGSIDLDDVQMVVLDEADEMLDMGFAEDLEEILKATPATRQTVLFSATMPPRIDAIARNHQRNPVRITIRAQKSEPGSAPLVTQRAYVVHRSHKAAALGRILDVEAPAAAIVFCRTRGEVDQLTETLNGRGYRAEALHGGMDQEQRDRVMGRFRNGTVELLLATDVAARGLDIDHLTHVVNYDVPSAPESYVHRIGRVGRAGRNGVAITLTEPREQRQLANIERLTKQKIAIERVPSVADLRARQMEQTTTTVREAMGSNDLDRFRKVVDALAAETDLMTVALAAVKLAHELGGAIDDEMEIPDLSVRQERPAYAGKSGDRGSYDRGAKGGDYERGAGGSVRFGNGPRKEFPRNDDVARLYVGAGRSAGVRPQDLVGAIANETRLSGRDIGSIKVGDHFSIVEIPANSIDDVIASMARTTIKGRKANVRKFVESRH
jgi:ATP-dependent RNA helicase DeaD